MALPDETDGLKEFGKALTQLMPAPSRIDRDGLLYAAGRLDGMRSKRTWQAASLAAVSAAILLAAWIIIRGPRVEDRIVVVNVPAPTTPTDKSPSEDATTPFVSPAAENFAVDRSSREQLEARWRVMRFGPESLPDHAGQVSADVPPAQVAEEDRGIFQGFSNRRLNLMLPK
jgi:hypothetical protein